MQVEHFLKEICYINVIDFSEKYNGWHWREPEIFMFQYKQRNCLIYRSIAIHMVIKQFLDHKRASDAWYWQWIINSKFNKRYAELDHDEWKKSWNRSGSTLEACSWMIMQWWLPLFPHRGLQHTSSQSEVS